MIFCSWYYQLKHVETHVTVLNVYILESTLLLTHPGRLGSVGGRAFSPVL